MSPICDGFPGEGTVFRWMWYNLFYWLSALQGW
jgi:hypothetical protein